MSSDRTLPQTGEELLRAQQRSLERVHPPTAVPGYDIDRFLGSGAYGEVWVATDRNTGRRVAIKFYTHRGGLDWSLLSREVEKLAFLFADRYVVQLIDVAWEAEPPYYIMEFLEQGSLEDRLDQGPLPADQAVTMFRDVAIGLSHSHGKGVLHCDLKPANVLLDQDFRPRLADFGQSRLSHEQTPALGTLFYMAPEQARLDAAPDVRWDVYALGALLYAMLTGQPPHRSPQAAAQIESAGPLEARLAAYRRLIDSAPKPKGHRGLPGVDRDLAEIIDRCLERPPHRRYANVQEVLTALDTRAARRARRPLLVLGAFGPVLLLALTSFFAWRGILAAEADSRVLVRRRALESNLFAAQLAAEKVSRELADNFQLIERVATDRRLPPLLVEAAANAELQRLADDIDAIDVRYAGRLAETDDDQERSRLEQQRDAAMLPLQEQFREFDVYQQLYDVLVEHRDAINRKAAGHMLVQSLVLDDHRGTALARAPLSDTTGRNFGFRTYFVGGTQDRPRTWRPSPGDAIRRTALSAVFQSSASGRWVVAFSSPVWRDEPGQGDPLAVAVMTVEVGGLIEKFEGREVQFATLVDGRAPNDGLILQHPLLGRKQLGFPYDAYRQPQFRVPLADVPDRADLDRSDYDCEGAVYRDPMRHDSDGASYDKPWLAVKEPVALAWNGDAPVGGDSVAEQSPPPGGDRPVGGDSVAEASNSAAARPTGLYVVMQEDFDAALLPVRQLGRELIRDGLLALGFLVFVLTALWGLVILVLNEGSHSRVATLLRRSAGLATSRTATATSGGATPAIDSQSSAQPLAAGRSD